MRNVIKPSTGDRYCIIRSYVFVMIKVKVYIYCWYLPLLTDIINDSLMRFKLGGVITLFKKANPFDKTNYRPFSLLFYISKVFERVIYNQINEYVEPVLSKVLTGFRKNHNTKYYLLKMLENFKKTSDQGNSVSAIFMELSKAFDTLNHDLLIAKLEAYSFSAKCLS